MSKNVNAISYSDSLRLIRNELVEVMNDNYALYQGLEVYIANEQEFIKSKQQKPNAIYIVLRYGSASVNFGQSVLPITITAICEQNKIDRVQSLFADFVAKFNLERAENNTIQQIYESPVVTSNFNQLFEGFRSIMYVSGFLVISKTANFLSFYYAENLEIANQKIVVSGTDEQLDVNLTIDEDKLFTQLGTITGITYPVELKYTIIDDNDVKTHNLYRKTVSGSTESWTSLTTSDTTINNTYGITATYTDADNNYTIDIYLTVDYEEIEYINAVFGGNTQLDPQTFYNYSNFTKSVAKAGTITFALTTYLLSSISLTNDVLAVYFKHSNINKTFKIKIKPTFGFAPDPEEFKLADCSITSEVGQIPMITMTFTN